MAKEVCPAPIHFFSAALENSALEVELGQAIMSALRSESILNGPEVLAFEEAVALRTGRQHAVAVASGTDALFLALSAIGLGAGDEVLVPAFSFAASAAAIARTGAQPVFVDVQSPESGYANAPFAINLRDAEQALTPATRGLLWVGLYGGLDNPENIEGFAAKHGLLLIEDAAQSFGARFGARQGGSIGAASALSFDRNKVLGTIGTGGAVTTDDAAIADFVRSMRWHGVKAGRVLQSGINSQLSSAAAAALLVKMRYHDSWTMRRQAIAARFDAGFADLSAAIVAPKWPLEMTHSRHKYVLVTPERAGLADHLARYGVPTKRHYDCALPDEPFFSNNRSPLPWTVARRCAEHALSLPMHAMLCDDSVEYIIKSVRSYFL